MASPSSTTSVMTDDRLPRPGEVWTAGASVEFGALLAAQQHSAARPRLSQRMERDLQNYRTSQAHLRYRPCIVFSVMQTTSTVRIFPITKLENQPLDVVNGHVKHFLVPLDDNEVGTDSQIVTKTTPPWPTAKSYVFGYPIDVPITAILHRHLIGEQTFDVDLDEIDKLQREAAVMLKDYKAIPESTMQRYNASWETDKLHRRDRDGLTVRASAPPERPSAARPRPVSAMLGLRGGLNDVNSSQLYPTWESRTAAAHPSPSSLGLDLGIDLEDPDQFPALHSADPAARRQRAASDPGVQSGSAWTQPLMRPREEDTAGLSASSQTVTIPPETVPYEEEVVEATEEAPFIDVSYKKRQSWGTGGAK